MHILAFLVAAALPADAALSPMDTEDLERAAALLRTHVAYIEAERAQPEGQPLIGGTVDGWGVVTGPFELTCQAFLVKDAVTIRVYGPGGRVEAVLSDLDVTRRVAHLRLDAPAKSVGLHPATPSPPEARETGMDVFALVSTRPRAGVVAGALMELGEEPWLEGNLRSSLHLERGMPVFDARARWLGISRTVAWDKDRGQLVPPELTGAFSATVTAAPTAPPPAAASSRPWWAR